MMSRLSPEINRLRLSGTEPITVYVDSVGGSVTHAERIRRLITAPNCDGTSCRLITVATGLAASAAADFLALGDYSIAFQHAEVLYHGTRTSLDTPVTAEGVGGIMASLQETNEFFAIRLAQAAFRRVALRVTQFADEFNEYRNDPSRAITTLAGEIRKKLSAPNKKLAKLAAHRQRMISELSLYVRRHIGKFKRPLVDNRFEAEMLKAVINYRAREHRDDPNWAISGKGLQEIVSDFSLLDDFHFGRQNTHMAEIMREYGIIFLSDDDRSHFAEMPEDEKKVEWLHNHCAAKLGPLWYFVVSYCRILQSEDFALSAEEAYWLGIVDEVPGSGLPNLRVMVENAPVTEAPEGV